MAPSRSRFPFVSRRRTARRLGSFRQVNDGHSRESFRSIIAALARGARAAARLRLGDSGGSEDACEAFPLWAMSHASQNPGVGENRTRRGCLGRRRVVRARRCLFVTCRGGPFWLTLLGFLLVTHTTFVMSVVVFQLLYVVVDGCAARVGVLRQSRRSRGPMSSLGGAFWRVAGVHGRAGRA